METTGAATPATAGGGGGGEGRAPHSHSISPKRKGKRRSGGYTELRSPRGGGWAPGGGSNGSVRGGRGSAEGYEDEDEDDEEEEDDEDEEEDEDGDGEAGSAPPKVSGRGGVERAVMAKLRLLAGLSDLRFSSV